MRYGTFLQNAEKLPRHTATHTPQLHLWENDLRCASYTPPAPVLFGLPHPPAAPSLGASARHVPGDDAPMRTPCGCSMAHWNLLPVRRGIPSVHTSLSQRSCTIVIPLQQPSVNTVETPENSAHMLTDHMGDNLSWIRSSTNPP